MFALNNEFVEAVRNKLQTAFGESIISFKIVGDMPQFIVKKQIITQLLQLLHDDEELKFIFLTDLCGVHYPEKEEAFGVIYHLHSFAHNQRIRIKAFSRADDLTFPTATTVFSAANWMERETYDFFGIIFEGHPDLRRILNVEEMEEFPLRKEFPLEDATRDDKDDKMFGR